MIRSRLTLRYWYFPLLMVVSFLMLATAGGVTLNGERGLSSLQSKDDSITVTG